MACKLVAALIVVAASGCRMCSDACDYSPPVPGGPKSGSLRRAGSAFNGQTYNTVDPPPQESTAVEADLNPQWTEPQFGP